jgi:hypothetical protein
MGLHERAISLPPSIDTKIDNVRGLHWKCHELKVPMLLLKLFSLKPFVIGGPRAKTARKHLGVAARNMLA